jgi:hypothetical protein
VARTSDGKVDSENCCESSEQSQFEVIIQTKRNSEGYDFVNFILIVLDNFEQSTSNVKYTSNLVLSRSLNR